MSRRDKSPPPLPTREQIIAFVSESTGAVGRREIARAFNIKGLDRVHLKALLKELVAEGAVEIAGSKRVRTSGSLPSVAVLVVRSIDQDGHVIGAFTFEPDDGGDLPPVRVVQDRKGGPAPGPGDRVLARIERTSADHVVGRVMRILDRGAARAIAVVEKVGRDFRARPVERGARGDFLLSTQDAAEVSPGDLVAVEAMPRDRAGLKRGRIVERLGSLDHPNAISRLAVNEFDIPEAFPAAAIAQAEKAKPVSLGNRTDLRSVPLITIDGSDARDFDDAVWASPDTEDDNPGGWRLLVAIADVAHYVRPGDPLDRAARERGNSVYFPDRVVPMLPEALSNGLCSLRPKEDRACLAVEIRIGPRGRKIDHRFLRGLMRSAARLTYEQVQAAWEDRLPSDEADLIPEDVLGPLRGAYAALLMARERRGALDLDLPERRVSIGDDGTVQGIEVRERLDSHRLIEEFMVTANVCAAETLEQHRMACMYRVHDRPDPEKVESLREVLSSMDIAFPPAGSVQAKTFNTTLGQVKDTPEERMVNELILRSQAQAVYAPHNLGHFGLSLRRYAHFTSPIRRYSDLIVHRGLIAALGFGPDGLKDRAPDGLVETGEYISMTERRAAAAERRTVDRFCARYLSDRAGETFGGSVSGIGKFGLFVRLDGFPADGLLPMKRLPDDYYDIDDASRALVGRSTGRRLALGDSVEVILREADPVTGGITLDYVSGGSQSKPIDRRQRSRGRPKTKRSHKKGRPNRRK